MADSQRQALSLILCEFERMYVRARFVVGDVDKFRRPLD
jgi:hypothetical protein